MTTIVQLNQEERDVARSLGFYIDTEREFPELIWLKGNGALSGHSRGATEAETRMWFFTLGREYTPWSMAPVSNVRVLAALQ